MKKKIAHEQSSNDFEANTAASPHRMDAQSYIIDSTPKIGLVLTGREFDRHISMGQLASRACNTAAAIAKSCG